MLPGPSCHWEGRGHHQGASPGWDLKLDQWNCHWKTHKPSIFQWVFLSRHKHGLFESYSSSRWCWSWKRAIQVERCGWDIAMPGKWCRSQHLRQAASWGGPLARLTKTLIQQISTPKKGTQFSIHGFVCFNIWRNLCFFIKHVGESQSPDDIAGVHWWGLARLLSCGLCTVAGARKLAQCRVGLGTKCSWPYGIKKPWSWGTRSSVTWLKLWGPFLKFWVDVVMQQIFEDFFWWHEDFGLLMMFDIVVHFDRDKLLLQKEHIFGSCLSTTQPEV